MNEFRPVVPEEAPGIKWDPRGGEYEVVGHFPAEDLPVLRPDPELEERSATGRLSQPHLSLVIVESIVGEVGELTDEMDLFLDAPGAKEAFIERISSVPEQT